MRLRAGRHTIELSQKTLIMGIINVTPDSFSDGGEAYAFEQAREKAESMIASGVDIIDIGGESSRPGSNPVSVNEEIGRVVPLIEYLSDRYPEVPLSVDTWKHEVAAAALSAGASIINDIYGLQADPQMASIISKHVAAVIIMHNAVMYRNNHPAVKVFASGWKMPRERAETYNQMTLLNAVMAQLESSIQIAESAGISREQIIVDPGIGFGLTTEESWSLIREAESIKSLGLPLLIAHSRKRFLGDLLGADATDCDTATTAATVVSVFCGADIVRVHNVFANKEAALVADKVKYGKSVQLEDKQKAHHYVKPVNQTSSPDKINMKGMVFHGYTGCLPEEKKLGQKFIVDVTLELLDDKASYSDLLADSVSYADVFEVIRGIMANRQFNLIEKLAGYIAEQILKLFPLVEETEVCVSKPQAPIAGAFDTMQVCVRRGRIPDETG